MSNEKPKRGRPPLSPEERELRRKESKKKYEQKRPDINIKRRESYKAVYDTIGVSVRKDCRHELDKLVEKTGMSMSALFSDALEEKYKINITKPL